MKPNQKRIQLDRSKLLGFKLVQPASTAVLGTKLGAKVGGKLAAKVGGKVD